jgi:hypothetical protein
MASNELGGFFVKLGALVDKASFDTGFKSIDKITNATSRLIGTSLNFIAAMGTQAVIQGKLAQSQEATASALGMSAERMDAWRYGARLIGVEANSTLSAMQDLNDAIKDQANGVSGASDKVAGYAKNLSALANKSGLDLTKILSDPAMGAEERVRAIFEAGDKVLKEEVSKGKDLNSAAKEVANLIGAGLGKGSGDFYFNMARQGYNLPQLLGAGASSDMTTKEQRQNLNDFSKSFSSLQNTLESFSKSLAGESGDSLKKVIDSLNSWLKEHGPALAKILGNILDILTKLLGPLTKLVADFAGGVIEGTADISEGVKKDLAGDREGANKKYEEGANKLAKAAAGEYIYNWEKEEAAIVQKLSPYYIEQKKKKQLKKDNWLDVPHIDFSLIPENLKKEWENIQSRRPNAMAQNYHWVQDGIIRPNGQVTQVAPDDWVFAARNIGDLASAFIPRNAISYGSGVQNFTITQTFTINGNTSTLPQTIKQQALEGTRGGLLQVLGDSSRRMQQMSGLR